MVTAAIQRIAMKKSCAEKSLKNICMSSAYDMSDPKTRSAKRW
eukprot:CAMPEP_0184420032 /NCGR_PEP_ID=MMETSP0738-20130409/46955_1 /TAXON_ID=385413 /ORGANISM="Thalassiosira miniscula, Strain CCMP1093" /LENGTH=42 /DNA_ID= /DNA_START= /DNA_END= /DNA_ORIENTATION=